MKIAFSGIDIEEGKHRYDDPRLEALAAKLQPDKVTPFYAELSDSDYADADAIAVCPENILDILIMDMEKAEVRSQRSDDPGERSLMEKVLAFLEGGQPLCDFEFPAADRKILSGLSFISAKPVLQTRGDGGISILIKEALDKSGIMFFYTAGKKEVRSWPVPSGSDALACAAKIHSDLAKGFIKADVVAYDDFMTCHSMNDAKSRGLAKLVDRDHVINDGDIIEIRFNV